MLKNKFFGTIVAEFPYPKKTARFNIIESGTFAIWHKSKFYKKNRVGNFKPSITNIATDKNVTLRHSLLRPLINGFDHGRMELFHFSAKKGAYQIHLKGGSSIPKIEKIISDTLPLKEADPNTYFIQVRKSQPVYLTIVLIILTSISGFLIIGGLVNVLLGWPIFN